MEIFLSFVLGVISMYWGFTFFKRKKSKELTAHQSVILLDKVKSVCKLISVEGDFAEIYQYENTKERFLSLVSSTKKALVVINAKVHIGYDLKKVEVKADAKNKKIILTSFPQPEILSISPELRFYDIKNGLFNSFSPDDLTVLNLEAKEHIKEKIPESGLLNTAKKEALETILLIEEIAKTIDWEIDYKALEISNNKQKLLK